MSAPEANRMLAAPIVRATKKWMDEEGERLSDGTFEPFPLAVLAERADVRRDTLEKILSGRMKTIDFDIADRLLAVMHLTLLWMTDPELHAAYESTHLVEGQHAPGRASGARTCARAGCSNLFVPPKNSPRKRYCSNNCRTTAHKHRKNPPKTQMRGPYRALEAYVCRNGHERTAANTGTNSAGHRYCKICHAAAQRNFDLVKRPHRYRTQVPA